MPVDKYFTVSELRSSSNVYATFYCVGSVTIGPKDNPSIETLADAIGYLWDGVDASGMLEKYLVCNTVYGVPEPT